MAFSHHLQGFSFLYLFACFRQISTHHLLCELFDGMLDLCGIDECPHFSLPGFWLVNIFRLRFQYQNQGIQKIGKMVLGVGKTGFSTICRRNKRSFLLFFTCNYPISFSHFFLFKGNSLQFNYRITLKLNMIKQHLDLQRFL